MISEASRPHNSLAMVPQNKGMTWGPPQFMLPDKLIIAQQRLSDLTARTPEPAQPPGPALKVPLSPVVALLSSMNATHKALSIPKKSHMIA